MKNKKFKFLWLSLFYILNVSVGSSSESLKIFRHVNDVAVEVGPQLDILIGENLTLLCKFGDLKSTGAANGNVTWLVLPTKQPHQFRFNDLSNVSYLKISNVKANQAGVYMCTNRKLNNYKYFYLTVKQNESLQHDNSKITKRKRDITYVPESANFNFSLPNFDSLNEIIARNRKMQEDLLKEVEISRNTHFATEPNNIYYNGDQFVHQGRPNENSFPLKPVLLMIGVFVILILVAVLIRCCGCCMDDNSSDNATSRERNGNARGRSRCGHLICSENACRYRIRSSPRAPQAIHATDDNRPLNEFYSTTLDLPPTYASSAHNSTQNLNTATDGLSLRILNAADNNKIATPPPSYDEAIFRVNHSNSHHGITINNNAHTEGDHYGRSEVNSSGCNNSSGGGDSGGGGGGDTGGGDYGGGGSND